VEEDRALDESWIWCRCREEQDVDGVAVQELGAVGISALDDLDLACRVADVELLGDLQDELADGGADEAHAQHSVDAATARSNPSTICR
jgi:hypothetical protein